MLLLLHRQCSACLFMLANSCRVLQAHGKHSEANALEIGACSAFPKSSMWQSRLWRRHLESAMLALCWLATSCCWVLFSFPWQLSSSSASACRQQQWSAADGVPLLSKTNLDYPRQQHLNLFQPASPFQRANVHFDGMVGAQKACSVAGVLGAWTACTGLQRVTWVAMLAFGSQQSVSCCERK